MLPALRRWSIVGTLFVLLLQQAPWPQLPGILGPTEEEVYFQEILSQIGAADTQLQEAAQAIFDCSANLSSCVDNPQPTVDRLNASRDGIVWIKVTVLSLSIPPRYNEINDLVADGLTDSIDGLDLYAQGLSERSGSKISAASDLLSMGEDKLEAAVRGLRERPPASNASLLLILLLGAVGASLAVTLIVSLWFFRGRGRS